MKKSIGVVLLSGGLDSATTASIAVSECSEVHAMTFNYGQRHDVELLFARRLANFFHLDRQVVVDIPAEIFTSSLVGHDQGDIPRNREDLDGGAIPQTYVPGRNILFLSYALAYAESIEAGDIYIGANAVDYSGYPDCRPEFIEAFNAMARAGTRAGVEGNPVVVRAPLIGMSKAEIITLGIQNNVDYSLTHSCYDPDRDGLSCGVCDSCILRKRGFQEAGVPDPTRYRPSSGE